MTWYTWLLIILAVLLFFAALGRAGWLLMVAHRGSRGKKKADPGFK